MIDMRTAILTVWMRLLRLYGWHFPVLRGKARIVHWAFAWLPKSTRVVQATIPGDIQIELWPWIWADFCTYMLGSPEPYHLAYFASRIHKRSIVFDVGAYIGVYALRAARIATEGHVHAFEPNPQSARRLQGAIEVNKIRNLILNQCAVSDRAGRMMMALREYPPKSSLCPSATSGDGQVKDGNIISVPVCTLDDYCRSKEIEHIDMLKIDVEGAEMLVLQGASDIIAASRPEIIIELHRDYARSFGHPIEEVLDYLYHRRYRLFRIFPGIRKPRLVFADPGMLAVTARSIIVARPI